MSKNLTLQNSQRCLQCTIQLVFGNNHVEICQITVREVATGRYSLFIFVTTCSIFFQVKTLYVWP